MPTKQTHTSPRIPRQRVLPVYLSIEEASEVMSLSTKTIRRRISDGSIPAYRCDAATSESAWTSSRQPSVSFPLPATDGPLVDT